MIGSLAAFAAVVPHTLSGHVPFGHLTALAKRGKEGEIRYRRIEMAISQQQFRMQRVEPIRNLICGSRIHPQSE